MAHVASLFDGSYEDSRERFRNSLSRARTRWPHPQLGQHRLEGDEDLTIDWIQADALKEKTRLLVLTSGQHGVEGYVGAAVLQLFLDDIVPRLLPRNAGLLVVHATNPWGMKHRRRTNAANVDLDRNFFWDPGAFEYSSNPDYGRLDALLNPRGPVRRRRGSGFSLACGLLRHLVTLGYQRFRKAIVSGQYSVPEGLYHGGVCRQEETRVVMDLLRGCMAEYERTVVLDLHAGRGPRGRLSLATSWMEPEPPAALGRRLSGPRVLRTDPSHYHALPADLIDYLYMLKIYEFPERGLFAAGLELGTLGDSPTALVRRLRAEILEHQLHRFGAEDQSLREWAEREFEELNAPQDPSWRETAVAEARQALEGILCAEGFMSR